MKDASIGQKLAVHVPVSIYLEWISLATIANISSVLNVLMPGMPLYNQAVWTAVMIFIVLIVTLLMLIRRRDIAYSLVVVWACIGIATKQALPVINVTALLVTGVISVAIILLPILKKRSYYLT
jgi:hypothetical protein